MCTLITHIYQYGNFFLVKKLLNIKDLIIIIVKDKFIFSYLTLLSFEYALFHANLYVLLVQHI